MKNLMKPFGINNGLRASRFSVGRMAGLAAAVLLCATGLARASLESYDAAITADAAGGLRPLTTLTSAVTLNGWDGVVFDFGMSSGDVTMEFILEGDPSVSLDSFLAVGQNDSSSLRYEQYNDTGELGFTQRGVADYQFSPGVPSPVKPTHLAFVWNSTALSLSVYVNGTLASTVSGVAASFAMPAGQGWLGASWDGTEVMVGTIHRVTVYEGMVGDNVILRHANAYGALVNQALGYYDAAITTDTGNGLIPVATLTSAVTLTGSGGSPFDFGANSGDVTMEVILQGDPSINIDSYLAVGVNNRSSLRYEQWNNTGQLGFTQIAVADYQFNPGVPSPTQPTHLTYVWNAATSTMKVYVNGALAGTASGISALFAMPTGPGLLGGSGGESMAGTIYRVTVYDDLLADEVVLRHARAFTDVVHPPIITSFTATPTSILTRGDATLSWAVENATTVTINKTDVTALTSLTVSPLITTTYTLTAENSLGSVSTKVTVVVNPKLDTYDAAIAADATGGLTPVATLASPVTLTGGGGAPFNFGPSSSDKTIEFIVEGDPSAGQDGYLAVGEIAQSSLRYEQWDNTFELGFTQSGVADYLFSPVVPSPTWPTHVTYLWNSASWSMSLYINGVLAGASTTVSASFVMPFGQGWLGANPGGTEAMVGTFQRVIVYDQVVSEEVILRHARAFLSAASPELNAYDQAVNDSAAGGLTPVARLTEPVTLTGAGGVPFNFGATSGEVTFEFILEGDPAAGRDGYLAVGANTLSSLRYEQWDNTGELGFTQGGAADYQFSPGVASPTRVTHVAYVWDATGLSMNLYTNGVLASTVSGVAPAFAMPTGLGWLGSSAVGTEMMVGIIHRLTVYDDIVPADVILAHAKAFLSVARPPVVSLNAAGALPVITLSEGTPGQHYRVDYRNSLAPTEAWQVLEDIPSLSGTTATVTDPTPVTSPSQRYYRAVLVP